MTFLLTLAAMLVLIALIAIKIIVLPDGEFRGTCSTNNEFLRSQGSSCPVCGKDPEEACPNQNDGG